MQYKKLSGMEPNIRINKQNIKSFAYNNRK